MITALEPEFGFDYDGRNDIPCGTAHLTQYKKFGWDTGLGGILVQYPRHLAETGSKIGRR